MHALNRDLKKWIGLWLLGVLGGCVEGSSPQSPPSKPLVMSTGNRQTFRAKPMPADSIADIAYEPDGLPAHTLDLYLPMNKRPEGLILFVHGGAWIGGDKGQFIGLGKRFAEDGFAVAVVNYRLSTEPSVKDPAHARDVAAAYSWLVSHASKYGFSGGRIFVGGHSAGAHNAGMLATGLFLKEAGVTSDHMPAGFFGLEGIYDIADLNRRFPSYRGWFLDRAFDGKPSWRAGSPSLRPVVVRAPWLVIHSTEDELVDTGQSKEFAEHLKGQGVMVQLEESPLGRHEEVVGRLSDPADPTGNVIETWARKIAARNGHLPKRGS